MLYSENTLRGYSIQARDGQMGKLDEVYFDDGNWWIRYMVVNVGNWLKRQQVLLVPEVLSGIDPDNKCIEVALTKKEVEESPDALEVTPVSREREIALHSHYDWTPYWHFDPVATAGFGRVPNTLTRPGKDVRSTLDIASDANAIAVSPVREGATDAEDVADEPIAPFELHPSGRLGNSRELKGYHVLAPDGDVGRVEDLLLDTGLGAISYLVIDTHHWLQGQKVVIPPGLIYGVQWDDAKVHLALTKEQVMEVPEYRAEYMVENGSAISNDFETQLQEYYWHKSL